MKLCIINDTHFGVRNDSAVFLEHFILFFEEQFFPYCVDNNIDTVLHLGDFFDRRKYINFKVLNQVRKRIIDKFKDNNITLHVVIGNHDTFYKNTNTIN